MSEEVEVTREESSIDVDVLRYEGTAFEVAKRLFEDLLESPLSQMLDQAGSDRVFHVFSGIFTRLLAMVAHYSTREDAIRVIEVGLDAMKDADMAFFNQHKQPVEH